MLTAIDLSCGRNGHGSIFYIVCMRPWTLGRHFDDITHHCYPPGRNSKQYLQELDVHEFAPARPHDWKPTRLIISGHFCLWPWKSNDEPRKAKTKEMSGKVYRWSYWQTRWQWPPEEVCGATVWMHVTILCSRPKTFRNITSTTIGRTWEKRKVDAEWSTKNWFEIVHVFITPITSPYWSLTATTDLRRNLKHLDPLGQDTLYSGHTLLMSFVTIFLSDEILPSTFN